jgi:tripartite ATP-independent transporter DctM subunit
MSLLASLITLLLALSGAPIFIVIALGGILSLHINEIDPASMIIEIYKLAHSPMLVAIPLFALAGYVLAASNAPKRMVRLSNALLGWLPGGLAIIALLSSALFTALTGATGLTIIALGGLLYPALVRQKFGESFSLGLLTTSGTLGLLFPPSLPIILYGIISQTNIDDLFLAGIIPGILLIVFLSLYSIKKGFAIKDPRPKTSAKEVWSAFREAAWELPLPLVVLGGIYSGVVALSEAASLTAIYVLFVEMLIYREVKLKDIPRIVRESMILVGGILIILGVSFGLTNTLVSAEIPAKILEFMKTHIQTPVGFLLWLNLFLLAAGCLIGLFPALTIVVPLILPVASAYGIHPLHLGIVLLTNLEIGASLPPVGINLFIASIRFEKPVLALYRASLPFIAILLLALLLITYLPALSLILT